jgi:hypothetical protein
LIYTWNLSAGLYIDEQDALLCASADMKHLYVYVLALFSLFAFFQQDMERGYQGQLYYGDTNQSHPFASADQIGAEYQRHREKINE